MACVTARAYGHRYIWIDSCCIDKASSSELSQAINSMYRWYRKATVCYAFLADVSPDKDAHDTASQIRRSRWFTRGWTLQELIAPRHVVFLSQEWHVLGSKSSLAPLLEEVTGIEREVLTHQKQLDAVSVAARMSWAARRSTTRVEDEAYSLLGTFDINMPTLYGEGRRAFARLQEEIVRQIPDQSLFAWGNVYLSSPSTPPHDRPSDVRAPGIIEFVFELDDKARSLFAPSPLYFERAGSLRAVSLEFANQRLGRSSTSDNAMPIPCYIVSPYGMRAELLLLDAEFLPFHGSLQTRSGPEEMQPRPSRQRRWTTQCTLPEWQKVVLQTQGYAVTTGTTAPIIPSGANWYHLILSNSNHAITVEYQYRLILHPHKLDDEIALGGFNLRDARDSSLQSSNADQLTVWLDAAVVPSSTSPPAFEPGGVGQEVSGPHKWVDFCAQHFEFPEVTLKTSASTWIEDNDGTRAVPSFVKVIRTIRLKVAIEPVAEADIDVCSHHILVDLVEDERIEEVVDLVSGTDSGRSVKDEDKGGGFWVAKVGQRFKFQTRSG